MYVDLQAVAVIYTKLLFSPDHARFEEIHTKAKFKLYLTRETFIMIIITKILYYKKKTSYKKLPVKAIDQSCRWLQNNLDFQPH